MTRYVLELPDIDYQGDNIAFPVISNRLTDIPERFYRYGNAKDAPFHCFVDDWRLEAIWRDPFKMVDRFILCQTVIAPDFTVETNDPLIHALYQVWRSRVIGRWWQDHGLTVIPALQWSRPEINPFLFAGLSQCDIVAVRSPTRGYVDQWRQCAEQFLMIHQPKLVLHFGTKTGLDVWPYAINLNLKEKM
jgi:hypothetical protein